MVCVSKTLLCVLGVVETGLAVRQNLSVERRSTAASVVDTVGALLQARKNKNSASSAKLMGDLRASARSFATPGAIDALNDALNTVISELEANVETKIKAGFSDTQSAIDTHISDLTTATSAVVAQKGVADTDDATWFSCVGNEKSKLEAVEAAEVALAAAQESTIVPCQNQEDRKDFNFVPTQDFEFACEFTAPELCQTEFNAYESMVNNMLSTLTADFQAASSSWQEAKDNCDAANADVAAKESALASANTDYTGQKQTCLEKHESRQLAICQFGSDLQQKCSDVFAYNSLMAEVDQVNGGVHSQPDRESEWQTTQVTKCMLEQIIAGADINDATLTTCENNVNFGTQVGVLDRKESEFAGQTVAEKFTCAEETITFNDGNTWEIPTGEDPHSSDYKIVPFAPQVDVLTPPAFSFCGGPGKN